MPHPPETNTEPAPASEPLPWPVLIGSLALSASLLIGAITWATVRLWPEKRYPTDTPMAVVESARDMLHDRRADRLSELIEAAPPDADPDQSARMQDLINRLGRVLAAAQDLHAAVVDRMPTEIDRLRVELEGMKSSGKPTSLLASLMPNRRAPDTPERRRARELAMSRVLADPFAGLDSTIGQNIDRVGIQELAPGTVAVTWDGRAVLPPFGLTMREHEAGWRVVPPTALPMLKRFMPESDAEFQVWGSLLATIESLLDDLRAQVESGRITTLDALSQKAIENAIIPMGMVMVALTKADTPDP